MMRMENKVVVVTGGATGIGYAIAERFAGEGAKIAIADIRGARDAAKTLTAKGIEAIGTETDVSDEASVAAMARAVKEALGNIDVLVNNAGIFTGLVSTPMEELSTASWRKLLDVNVMGPWLCASACLPQLRETRGNIVNITSVIAHVGIPYMLHYVASKGALLAMTRGMARELAASGVRVNSVSPGYTHSDNAKANAAQHEAFEGVAGQMRLITRAQTPADLAGAVLFMASEDGGYVTGQNLIVDGGTYLGM